MLEAAPGERRDHRREILAGVGGSLRIDAMARQLGGREEHATLAQICFQRPQPIGEADHQTDLAADLEGRRVGRAEDHQGRLDDGRAAALELLFEGLEIGGRRIFQLALAGIERRLEAGAAAASGVEPDLQGQGDRMGRRPTGVDRIERVAPPLQANQAGHRLADHVADLADLVVEGVEREQRLARHGRREQGRKIAVRRRRPDQPGAVGELAVERLSQGSTGCCGERYQRTLA